MSRVSGLLGMACSQFVCLGARKGSGLELRWRFVAGYCAFCRQTVVYLSFLTPCTVGERYEYVIQFNFHDPKWLGP